MRIKPVCQCQVGEEITQESIVLKKKKNKKKNTITKRRKPCSDQLHMESTSRREATKHSAAFEPWQLFHPRGPYYQGSWRKPFGVHQLNVHCLSWRAAHLEGDRGSCGGTHTLNGCVPPRWQLGKMRGYLMWGNFLDKYWKHLQNYTT